MKLVKLWLPLVLSSNVFLDINLTINKKVIDFDDLFYCFIKYI